MTVTQDVLEADLRAGRLCCSGCGGPLAPWGFARERPIRLLQETRWLRPRRARCRSCRCTHVMLPAWSVPRRRDGAEAIGLALLAHSAGAGHRAIAERLERPPTTVRGWLRAAHAQAGRFRATALAWAREIEPWQLEGEPTGGSLLADALDALGTAIRACKLNVRTTASEWE